MGFQGRGVLDITNGGAVSSRYGYLGHQPSGGWAATVAGGGSTWTVSQSLYVGGRDSWAGGAGELTVRDGGAVNVGDTVKVWGPGTVKLLGGGIAARSFIVDDANGGTFAHHDGTLTVQGGTFDPGVPAYTVDGNDVGDLPTLKLTANAAGSLTSNLTVGNDHAGAFEIGSGADMTSSIGIIGNNSGSEGTAILDGIGSTWTNSFDLYAGVSGRGTLNISNRATVSNTGGYVGYQVGSHGTVTVDGSGSRWTNSSYLYVGRYGTGELNVTNGGAVTSATGYIGYQAGSSGAVAVDGGPSTWSNSSDLYVGAYGSGMLSITGGGAVSDEVGYIGEQVGGNGMVTVEGNGSRWTNSSHLYVGVYGNGVLSITGGGSVSDTYAYIGYQAGSSGTVTVDGSGSTWSSSPGNLNVGHNGNGMLDITNGGAVSNRDGYVGYHGGASGAVTVDGSGSRWTGASYSFYVGVSGSGTLSITNGGAVSNREGHVGYYNGASGALTVDGSGSTWAVSDDLSVGVRGAGVADITNGGSVSCTNGYVGYWAEGGGSVLVDFGTWTNTAALTVGLHGTGTLEIAGAGGVSSAVGYIGRETDSNGTVSVGGPGSLWSNSGNLYVGGDGTGRGGSGLLAAANGGEVEVGEAMRLWPTGRIRLDAGGLIVADQVAFAGGAVDAVPDSVLRVNALNGDVDDLSLGGSLQIGHAGGAGIGGHTVRTGHDLTVGGDLLVSFDAPASLTVEPVGDLTVAGALTVRPAGAVELRGGTIRIPDGRLVNYGRFTYRGGVFDGVYEHRTAASGFDHEADFTAEGGIVNHGQMCNREWLSITANGQGLLNYGRFDLHHGTLGGSGVLNECDGEIHASGYSTIDADVTNYGTITTDDLLTVTGKITNQGGGEIDLTYQQRLRLNGGMDNHAILTFREGGVIEGPGRLVNKPNGYIEMLGGGSITAPLTNYGSIDTEDGPGTGPGGEHSINLYIEVLDENHGDIYVGDWFEPTTRLHIDSSFVNFGAISLDGEGTNLSGGDITNEGIIVGSGSISNRVDNAGLILGGDDSLGLHAAGCTNIGRIEVPLTSRIAFIKGLATNDGVIALTGGAFHNSRYDMTSNGLITGYGSFHSGELTNNGRVGVGVGDMNIYGPVVNNGDISVEAGSTAVFFSDVSGPGNFPEPGTAMFLGGYSPGKSASIIDFGGDVTFGLAASLKIELADDDNSDPLDLRYDALNVADDVTLGGTLLLEWLAVPGDPSSKFGGTYSILTYGGTRTGVFEGIDCTMAAYLDTSLFADGIEYDDANGEIKIHLYDLLDGDADLDGVVARSDFHALQVGFAAPDPDWFDGDFNFDGRVDFLDYLTWKANVGDSVPGTETIPEPSCIVLLLLGFAAVTCRRASPHRLPKADCRTRDMS